MSNLPEILAKLISFKTVTGDFFEAEKAFAWIKKEIRNFPLFVRNLKIGGYSSLVITTKKTKCPEVFLAAHIDVVHGPANLFKAKISGNRLYGRGAHDMKFAIACYLHFLQQLGEQIKDFDLGIIITSDEEKGGFNGVEKILERGYSSQVCFLPDGGNNWQIEKEAKGVWHLAVYSRGKSAHGARPWLGESALEKLFDSIAALKREFPTEPCGSPDHFHETINIGRVEGGDAVNKVPDRAFALVDIRFPSESKKKKIKKAVAGIAKTFPGIKVESIYCSNVHSIDKDNKFIKLFSKIAYDKYKIRTSFISSHGTSDARFFSAKGISVIATRPKGGGLHSDKEWVDLKDLERFYAVMKEFVERVAKK